MKKITFLRNLIVLVALLIGSGSAMGGTHITEGFSTTSLPSGWSGDVYFNTTANIGNLSGGNGAGFNASNKYLQLPSVNSAGTLTFWIKGSAASSQISLRVEMSVGGGSFTTIAEFPKPHTTTAVQKTVDINNSSNNIILKFVAYDRTGNSIYLDDIVLTDYIACTASNLAFDSPTTVEKLADDVNFIKTATSLNETTAIVYSSSDTDVATVNSSTGEVDILAAGTTTITATQAAGTHSSVDYCAGEVTYTLNVAPVDPTITVTEETVPALSAYVDNTDTETITVNGVNLTGNITLAVTGANASLFTLSTNLIVPTSGSVTDQSVTVTYSPIAPGSHTATLTLSSPDAQNVVRELSGSAEWTPLAKPNATYATGISQNGFTANWDAVVGATEYELNVYTKQISESPNLVVNPDFETGETSPWVFESSMNQQIVSDIVKSGTFALRTSVIATKNLNQSINVENQKEYKLSFWYYITDASTGNGFRVWTTSGATINLPSSTTYFNTKGSWQYVETTFTTSASVLVLNFRTYNGCTLYLDDIKLTSETTTSNTITGSPFTVIGETSKAITGLTPSTTYYYTVKAKNTNVTSEASNEVSVVTSIGTSTDNPTLTNIYAHNAKIHFAATAGEKVEVYNAVGQKIISTLATDGQNELTVNGKGVMIVKVGSRLAKVIL